MHPRVDMTTPAKRAIRKGAAFNRNVVAVAYDGLCSFEFGIVVEVFGLERPEMGPDWYRFQVASVDQGRLRASGGVRLLVDGDLNLLRTAGTIVLPGWRSADSPAPAGLIKALRAAHARGARIVTICSGVFALAATGLLDGKRATTHWRYMEKFEALFPKVKIERDVLYVDEGQVLSSAGSAAGIDLCLHLVRRDFGVKAANMVARRMVVQPHREGGQRQYVEAPVPAAHEGSRLSPLIDRLPRRLDENLSVAALAREAGMSERTFIRRFQAATGMAPGRWITMQRVQRARAMLETTKASVDEIAAACGFSEASTLRRHFQNHLGATPAAYRARFGCATR